MTRTHALYRFFAEDGELLYVGITINPAARWPKHRSDKPWWTEVTDISVETFKSREAALEAEREAIKTEHPVYNIVHAERLEPLPRPAPAVIEWLCDSCGEPVHDGDGMIGVSGNEIARYSEEVSLVEATRGTRLLLDWPDPAPWQVCHFGIECELDLDAYTFVIERIRTPALLLSVTAFLMEKTWLDRTDWPAVLRRGAGLH